MTHDELLAKINYYTVCTQPTKPEMVCDNEHLKEIYPEWFALRAVVELHKPVTTTIGSFCKACGITSDYPCPTIQAIEKELR